ncbi:type VI secretion system Vgr family protein [Agaribacterium haliotis]|uniref:type VI secretion system Vgr family protein n=1 Tax=Agaribacterium haliotis TaxID=2013869 RepID=UPI000BB55676|nr:type VI secretion system tip protein TssI/VgrG [Agaribacterium haliotis]
MGRLSQDNRFLTITDFGLGEDTFLVSGFNGSEFVSDLYEFQVDLISENLDVSADKVVGKTATLTINSEAGRCFHGYVSSFSRGATLDHDKRRYRVTLVPWLWFLSKTNNHRIFQEKNSKQIVSEVFQELGFNDFDYRAEAGSVREYCVQHNESDLNFISRLLEEDGVAYYFKHADDKHQLVLVDKKNAYESCTEEQVRYFSGSLSETHVSEWQRSHNYKKGAWAIGDYNFKEPNKKLRSEQKSRGNFAMNSKFEHYEFPDMYNFKDGDKLVKMRLDAEEVERESIEARSDCASFFAGGKFKLKDHEVSAENGAYVLLAVHHHGVDDFHFDGERSVEYGNEFICIPEAVQYRPARIHQKPMVYGPQSAVVVGPSGEEIYTDDYGRIKVQFHWDRLGKNDENSSCFLRVAQSWAGAQWGASFIPRIGHEVIVSFLNGDPDRPLVTGSVYNEKNKPVFSSKTQSGIKTRSTKGGDSSAFNELRFDDKKDAEQIYVHAQRNLDTQVENDETHTVDNDRQHHVKHDENLSIDNDRNKVVGQNQAEDVGKDKSISVGQNHSEDIGKNMTLSVGADISVDIAANHTEQVGKAMSVKIGTDLSEQVGGSYSEKVSKDYSLKADKVLIEASKEITLKTGGAQIVMKSNGDIQIKGKNINVKGSGKVAVKGSSVAVN